MVFRAGQWANLVGMLVAYKPTKGDIPSVTPTMNPPVTPFPAGSTFSVSVSCIESQPQAGFLGMGLGGPVFV